MAFTRRYAQEGDPWSRRSLYAGKLVRPDIRPVRLRAPSAPLPARFSRGRRWTPRAASSRARTWARSSYYEGDPFFKKLGKFIKRATKPPAAIREAVRKLAPVASLGLSFVPGVGKLVDTLKATRVGRTIETARDIARAVQAPPPEPMEAPELFEQPVTGTIRGAMTQRQPLSEPEYDELAEEEYDELEYDEPEYDELEYDADEYDESLLYEEDN